MLKSLICAIFLVFAFVNFSQPAAAQTAKNVETVAWKYETKNYNLEMKLTFAGGKAQSYAVSTWRLTNKGESAHECDTLVKRGADNSVWSDNGAITRITGENDLGAPIDIAIEKRKNGFFVKSNLCENVGIPNVLLTKKGKKYVGRVVR